MTCVVSWSPYSKVQWHKKLLCSLFHVFNFGVSTVLVYPVNVLSLEHQEVFHLNFLGGFDLFLQGFVFCIRLMLSKGEKPWLNVTRTGEGWKQIIQLDQKIVKGGHSARVPLNFIFHFYVMAATLVCCWVICQHRSDIWERKFWIK